MATRLDTTLKALKSQGKKALIPYVMAGDSDPSVTVPLLHRMVEAGSDIIEVGLPFSDPMADGPVIALAAERALAAGTARASPSSSVSESPRTCGPKAARNSRRARACARP